MNSKEPFWQALKTFERTFAPYKHRVIGEDPRTIEKRLTDIKLAMRQGDIHEAAYEAQQLSADAIDLE